MVLDAINADNLSLLSLRPAQIKLRLRYFIGSVKPADLVFAHHRIISMDIGGNYITIYV